MHRTSLILLPFLALLVALVTSCGGVHRYDGRLTATDSLMWDAPDSALTIVSAIDMLRGEADRAYRDLLLTQARYKAYQEITTSDDSAITRAMDYYRVHSGDREKLTRAYLYKGAVMEELGHVDSAMYYYKTAEANTDSKDYFTLGYVNMRMGALYRDHYSLDGKDIEKYELANRYLQLTDDKYYQLRCKINLGSLYRLNNPKEAEVLLNEAMSLAQEMNDTSNYISCIQNLIILYDHYEKYDKAREQIHQVFHFSHDRISNLCLSSSARVYAKLGLIDSADIILNLTKSRSFDDPVDELSLYEGLSAIALARGDSLRHLQYEQQCKHLTDSLKTLQQTVTILSAEHEFDQAAKSAVKQQHKRTLVWLIGVCIIAILMLSFIHYRRVHRYDKIIDTIKLQSANQLNDLSLLKQNIENLKIQDHQLKNFISSHLSLMGEMIEACYRNPNSKLSEQVKRIIQFQQDNQQQWTQLYHYIDAEYNGIISKTRNSYPQLNDKDLLLIALTSMGFSYVQIAIIMGYTNATSVGTIKQRLAQKMHLDGSLNDYIKDFISSGHPEDSSSLSS